MPSLPKAPPRPWIPKREPRAYVKPQTEGAGFYQSPEWKETRKAARRTKGEVCVMCGKKGWIVDHINPVRLGGAPLDQSNLQILCTSCHNSKSARERHQKQ